MLTSDRTLALSRFPQSSAALDLARRATAIRGRSQRDYDAKGLFSDYNCMISRHRSLISDRRVLGGPISYLLNQAETMPGELK
jgi:hypothetical protein